MLFDVRTYRCKPGFLKPHMDLYKEAGYEVQCKHLGKPLFYGVTESGAVNTYMHIWVYENAGDREKKRNAMWADPVWLDYVGRSSDLGGLVQQDNATMTAADFYQCPVSVG